MLLEQLSWISIEKLMIYVNLDGFLRFLARVLGGLWRAVAACGNRVLPLSNHLFEESEPGSFNLAGLA